MHTSPRILSLSIAPHRSKGTSVNMNSSLFATVALAALSGLAKGESCYCTEQYNPICASNGKVFSNLCMLKCHNFNNDDNLQVAEFDQCSHSVLPTFQGFVEKESCYCTEQYDPVCASNGKVFSNLCMLRCHNFNNHDNLQVAEFDQCSHPVLPAFQEFAEKKFNCFRICPHTPLPVCGSDGVTYGSTCALNCVKKMDINKQDVRPLYKGHCRPLIEEKVTKEPTNTRDSCGCTAEFKPVCGNNLHTYVNRCAFECEAKKNPSLKLMYGRRCIILP